MAPNIPFTLSDVVNSFVLWMPSTLILIGWLFSISFPDDDIKGVKKPVTKRRKVFRQSLFFALFISAIFYYLIHFIRGEFDKMNVSDLHLLICSVLAIIIILSSRFLRLPIHSFHEALHDFRTLLALLLFLALSIGYSHGKFPELHLVTAEVMNMESPKTMTFVRSLDYGIMVYDDSQQTNKIAIYPWDKVVSIHFNKQTN